MHKSVPTFLRYPGSKRRMLDFLSKHLPSASQIEGRFIEPFVGAGAIYFYLRPRRAVLGDINEELIDLYKGIKFHPQRVWEFYRDFPSGKRGFQSIRKLNPPDLVLSKKAARSLYLNRTCFKGMWRHNRAGGFNVGYGGESRRWVLSRKDLILISKTLKGAVLKVADFEQVIVKATKKDFLYLDPPYRPGSREQTNEHYCGKPFLFADHQRLSRALRSADHRGIRWALTTSSHPDIKRLFSGFKIIPLPKGTGPKPGMMVRETGEILIANT